jgi:hypothetical protein
MKNFSSYITENKKEMDLKEGDLVVIIGRGTFEYDDQSIGNTGIVTRISPQPEDPLYQVTYNSIKHKTNYNTRWYPITSLQKIPNTIDKEHINTLVDVLTL